MNGVFNDNIDNNDSGEMVMTAMTKTMIVVMMVRGGYKLFGRQLPTMIYYSHTPGGHRALEEGQFRKFFFAFESFFLDTN